MTATQRAIINHVCCPRDTAELSGSPSTGVIERFDRHDVRAKQANKTQLPPAIAPDLADDARGDCNGRTSFERPSHDGHHASVALLKRGECSGIEDGATHRRRSGGSPSASSAASRSAPVRGPPVSANNSTNSPARSSSRAFCSSAAAT